MTSYQMPGGLLADPYAGAFGPQAGLLADPAALQQFAQSPQGQRLAGLLGGGRNMAGDMQPNPAASGMGMGTMPVGSPIPNGPAVAPGAGNKPAGGMPSATQPMQPGMGATGPQAPAFAIPSAYALPISPKMSLADISTMYQPAASPDGKLPPMGIGGLRRMYASPDTLAAEAEAAKQASTATPPAESPQQPSGDGSPSEGVDTGGEGTWRKGGYIKPDGDGKLEARRGTVHEGEVVVNPEAVQMLGKEELLAANRRALAMKKRPMGLLG